MGASLAVSVAATSYAMFGPRAAQIAARIWLYGPQKNVLRDTNCGDVWKTTLDHNRRSLSSHVLSNLPGRNAPDITAFAVSAVAEIPLFILVVLTMGYKFSIFRGFL